MCNTNELKILLLFQTEGDLQKTYLDRVDAMNERKRTVQPFMIVVSTVLSSIKAAYVCFDGIFYKFPSTIEALSGLFQTFHVLDTSYPPESSHLWGIIEQAVYGIAPTPTESTQARTTEVVAALASKHAFRQEAQEKAEENSPLKEDQSQDVEEVSDNGE